MLDTWIQSEEDSVPDLKEVFTTLIFLKITATSGQLLSVRKLNGKLQYGKNMKTCHHSFVTIESLFLTRGLYSTVNDRHFSKWKLPLNTTHLSKLCGGILISFSCMTWTDCFFCWTHRLYLETLSFEKYVSLNNVWTLGNMSLFCIFYKP